MTQQRVLLVEDDAAIRSWVAMALDGEGVDLQVCADVDTALKALREQPVQLLITDLMLPGRNGYDLLEALAGTPALRAGACLVAFSAGLDAQALARVQGLGVWRCLGKPASLAQLLACVHEGLAQARLAGAAEETACAGAAWALASAPGLTPAGETDASADVGADVGADVCADVRADVRTDPRTDARADARADARTDAVQRHFGGNHALFDAFEASCHLSLPADLRDGQRAADERDLLALRRLAHSLKSVLLMLGLPALASQARALEAQALAGDWPGCASAWPALQAGLQRWLDGGVGSATR